MKNNQKIEVGDLVSYQIWDGCTWTTGVVVSKRKYPKLSVRFHDGHFGILHKDNLKIETKAKK
jgi:hypothetical protein